MGELVGYVTRVRGGGFDGMGGLSGETPGICRSRFVAYKAGGVRIESYETITEAKRAVQSALGGKLLQWARVDLPQQIEHYEGRSTQFYPGDLGTSLLGGAWWRADQGLFGPNATTSKVKRWVSRDGATQPNLIVASQPLLAEQPEVVTISAGGMPALRFSQGATQWLGTNLTLGAPMSIFAVPTYQPAAHGGNQHVLGSARFIWYYDSATGLWTADNAGGVIAGPAAVAGRAVVLSALCNTAALGGCECFVNGVSIGTSPLQPGAFPWLVSNAITSWAGYLSEILIVPSVLPASKHDAVVGYMMRRYMVS